MWDTLRAGPPPSSLPIPAPERKRKSAPEALESLQAAPQPKRRQSGADTMIRIQPKPSSNGSPLSFTTPPATQPKKRGRPSKADVEARNAAAIARGEVIPPPKTPVGRESMGGDASAESGISSGGYGGPVAIAPLAASGPVSGPRMSTSVQSGPSEGAKGDLTIKKRRGRPSSRSSKVGDLFELLKQEADKSQKEPNQGEGSFSTSGQPFGQFEMTQPPTTKPAEKPSELPALPPKPEEGGIAAPVFPAIQELLSPEPRRPERSDI